jgi:hypothetical protein
VNSALLYYCSSVAYCSDASKLPQIALSFHSFLFFFDVIGHNFHFELCLEIAFGISGSLMVCHVVSGLMSSCLSLECAAAGGFQDIRNKGTTVFPVTLK